MHAALEWQNLLFLLPLLFGMILVFGAGFGLMDLDLDLDVDVDADADADADGETEGGGIDLLALMGVGRAPLSVLLMVGSLTFGAIGIASNFLAIPIALGVVIATATSLLSTAFGARLLARAIPTTESYALGKHELVGCLGVTELAVDEGFGLAHVTDDGGTLHKIRCRVEEAPLAKGTPILVTDFDDASGLYTVERSPL